MLSIGERLCALLLRHRPCSIFINHPTYRALLDTVPFDSPLSFLYLFVVQLSAALGLPMKLAPSFVSIV